PRSRGSGGGYGTGPVGSTVRDLVTVCYLDIGPGTLPRSGDSACPNGVSVRKLCNRLLLGRRGAQDRELVCDLQLPRAEAHDRRRAAAASARGTPLTRGLDHPAAQQHALQVRRRDVVAERRSVEVPELRDRALRRREREADVRVRELCAQPLAPCEGDLAVVECKLGQG